MKRQILYFTLTIFLISTALSCKKSSDNVDPLSDTITIENPENYQAHVSDLLEANKDDHEDDADYTWDASSVTQINLKETTIEIIGSGASANGSVVTIASAGNYLISGTLNNGQIIVNAANTDLVKMKFNAVHVTCSTNAPISIVSADKVIVFLADGTENYLTDGASYVFANAGDDEPNATLFSKTDLSICGNGSLTVKANYNDGISSKDGLIIKSGTLSVTSVDDGIRGKDYLVIREGNITINATGDGLKSDNDEDSKRGYILVNKGTISITSGGDAIAAETDVLIQDGNFNLKSGGGNTSSVSGDLSAKSIKGVVSTLIESGIFTINSADDAIHSNSKVIINGGTFSISTADDGIHADTTLGINGGTVNITKCYEGIESANLLISSGNIHILSSDDGLNGAGGNDGSGNGGWQGSQVPTGNYHLYVTGGYIYINAKGDGVDVNGSIDMSGGTIIVDGPVDNANGPLDYDNSFKITGGFVLAVGSAGMSMAPGTTSTQNSVLINLSSSKNAGTLMHIKNSSGDPIVTFAPAKKYQSIALSSANLITGSNYEVYFEGSSTGSVTDGLYQEGTYTPGSLYTSFKISGVVTKIGNSTGPGF